MVTDASELEVHRPALTGHCYRMLGSVVDADDAVQEAMLRALRSLEKFDGRASLRTWLYRIATNVCLDYLTEKTRRFRPIETPSPVFRGDNLTRLPRTRWLEPMDDLRALPEEADPLRKAILRQSIRLAFVAALQNLAPRQRAVLLLVEVLGWSAAEVAGTLETTVAAVNSALQRARTSLADAKVPPFEDLTAGQAELLARYVRAFEAFDVDGLVALVHDDIAFSMPPYELWHNSPAAVHAWLSGPGQGCQGSRLVSFTANGSPAFAQYRARPEGGHHAWALVVLSLRGEKISEWTSFLDVETLFPRFGLPLEL